MSDEFEEVEEEFRYVYIVRQRFGEVPIVDSFYQITVPDGISGEQAQVMVGLNENFCKEAISEDGRAITAMSLRLRFNQDMFQHVCLVRTHCEITIENLEAILAMKHKDGELMEFLKESAVG